MKVLKLERYGPLSDMYDFSSVNKSQYLLHQHVTKMNRYNKQTFNAKKKNKQKV